MSILLYVFYFLLSVYLLNYFLIAAYVRIISYREKRKKNSDTLHKIPTY